jgi:hypothetical protein
MLVSNLLKGSLRKIGALASGQQIPAAEAQEALDLLRQMYLEMVGAGTFGRQADVYVPDNSPDFTASEARRYTVKDLDNIVITLPEVVTDSWYACVPPYGSMWVPQPPVTTTMEPITNLRPPLDGSLVTEMDLTAAQTRTFVYDSAIARWTSLQDLDLTDEAPLSTRYAEGLMCELALRLSAEYGQEPPVTVVRGAALGRSAMVTRFDGPERFAAGIYF